jgi:hypothetical protein
MSDMTRREFTALIGDLAGARTKIEAIKALRAARRMDAILRIVVPRMPGAARGIPSA